MSGALRPHMGEQPPRVPGQRGRSRRSGPLHWAAGTLTLQGSGPGAEGSPVSAGVSRTDGCWAQLPTRRTGHRTQHPNLWNRAPQSGGGRPRTTWQRQVADLAGRSWESHQQPSAGTACPWTAGSFWGLPFQLFSQGWQKGFLSFGL